MRGRSRRESKVERENKGRLGGERGQTISVPFVVRSDRGTYIERGARAGRLPQPAAPVAVPRVERGVLLLSVLHHVVRVVVVVVRFCRCAACQLDKEQRGRAGVGWEEGGGREGKGGRGTHRWPSTGRAARRGGSPRATAGASSCRARRRRRACPRAHTRRAPARAFSRGSIPHHAPRCASVVNNARARAYNRSRNSPHRPPRARGRPPSQQRRDRAWSQYPARQARARRRRCGGRGWRGAS